MSSKKIETAVANASDSANVVDTTSHTPVQTSPDTSINLATSPNPLGRVEKELVEIPVNEIYSDLDRNFRDPKHDYKECQPTEKYDDEKYLAGKMQRGLFESVYYEGVKVPVWLAELTPTEAAEISKRIGRDVKYRTIRGHRRMVTVENVNTHYPGHILTVPAIIHRGLSTVEEWSLMADHGGVNKQKDLSELGTYRACVKLFGTGEFSHERIGQMIGESRGWVQRRVWIHMMRSNTPVETEFLKRFDKETYKPGTYYSFTYADVQKLYEAYKAMKDAGDLANVMADGSQFRQVWDRFAATGTAKPPAPKTLTREKIDQRDSFIANCPPLVEYAKFATGRGGSAEKAAELYEEIRTKAEKSVEWETKANELAKQVSQLQSELESALQANAELMAEIDALKAEKSANVKAHATTKRK